MSRGRGKAARPCTERPREGNPRRARTRLSAALRALLCGQTASPPAASSFWSKRHGTAQDVAFEAGLKAFVACSPAAEPGGKITKTRDSRPVLYVSRLVIYFAAQSPEGPGSARVFTLE